MREVVGYLVDQNKEPVFDAEGANQMHEHSG